MSRLLSKYLREFPPGGLLAAILGACLVLSGCESMQAKKDAERQDEMQSMMRHMRPPGDHPEPYSFSNAGRSIEKDLGIE
jgi:hypothetical protein